MFIQDPLSFDFKVAWNKPKWPFWSKFNIFLKNWNFLEFNEKQNGNACSIYFIDVYSWIYTCIQSISKILWSGNIRSKSRISFWLWVMDKLVFGTWENMHHLLSRFLFLKNWTGSRKRAKNTFRNADIHQNSPFLEQNRRYIKQFKYSHFTVTHF